MSELAATPGSIWVIVLVCAAILALGSVLGTKRSQNQARTELGGLVRFILVVGIIVAIAVAAVAAAGSR